MAAALAVVFVRACRAKKKTVVYKDVIVWLAAAGLFTIAFVMEFGKNKEIMLRNNWVMFFTIFPMAAIGAAALLGAFRFDESAPRPPKQRERDTGRGDTDRGAKGGYGRGSGGYSEPVFDDDDEW